VKKDHITDEELLFIANNFKDICNKLSECQKIIMRCYLIRGSEYKWITHVIRKCFWLFDIFRSKCETRLEDYWDNDKNNTIKTEDIRNLYHGVNHGSFY